jgi:hypothetical protein
MSRLICGLKMHLNKYSIHVPGKHSEATLTLDM